MPFGVRLRVKGPYACFTRPELKVERVSYDVMPPSAARGILEAIHWKPAIRWVIDAIHVLKPVRFQSIRRNEVGSKARAGTVHAAMLRGTTDDLALVAEEDRQLRSSLVLVDVDYVIEAHFERTASWGADDSEGKHLQTFQRRAAKGQSFHQPCLGTREFPAAFELIEPDAIMPEAPERPDLGFGMPRDLGIMLWDIDHGKPDRPSIFFRAMLDRGVVRVPQPGSTELLQ